MASFWESVKSFLRREAADVKEGVDALREKLDAELTKRERELEATPSERIEMLQSDMDETEDIFDRLEEEIDARAQASDDAPGTADADPDAPGGGERGHETP